VNIFKKKVFPIHFLIFPQPALSLVW